MYSSQQAADRMDKASQKKQAEILLEYMDENYMENYMETPTRGQNILDLVLCNNASMLGSISTMVSGHLSDHYMLEIPVRHHYTLPVDTSPREVPYTTTFHQYMFHKADAEDWMRYEALMRDVDWEAAARGLDVEAKLHKFLDVLETVVAEIFKKKKHYEDENSDNKPQKKNNNKIPDDVRLLMRQKKEISDRILKSKSWLKIYKLEKELEAKEEALSKKYKDRKLKVEQEAIGKIKSNPKFFYSYAKKSSKAVSSIGTLIGQNGELLSDSKDKSECLKRQYESVFTEPDDKYKINNINEFCNIPAEEPGVTAQGLDCQDCVDEVVHECTEDQQTGGGREAARRLEDDAFQRRNQGVPDFSTFTFHVKDVVDAITSIPSGASPGPDGVPPCLLKNAKHSIGPMLHDIFSDSFDKGEIPAILKLGLISPIHKGGSTSDPANYRPISLTSHIIKVGERVMRHHLVNHLEVMGKMDDKQHGSRKGRSTLSQLLEHHLNVIEALESNSNFDTIYLDFAKAFDKCDIGILMCKAKKLGITGKAARWLHSFLTNRRQQVVVEGRSSSVTRVTSGVPQGTVLGPVMFLLYISDISDNVNSCIKIYVDDTKASQTVKNSEDVETMQEDLNKLYKWSKLNNMKFNGRKFQVMRYGRDEKLKDDTLYFTEDTGEPIERHETLRDLGVILSDDGTFSEHIDHVVKKVRQKSGWVLRTFYSRKTFFMKQIFKTLILPHIDYTSQLWCPIKATEILKIEKLQKDFFNRIPGLKHLNYWQKLDHCKMLSVQRRLERYRILTVWKTLEGLVPNCGISIRTEEGRSGRTCKVPSVTRGARAAVTSMKEQTLQVHGPKLFNSLPPYLRNLKRISLDDFKMKLDKYLEKVPDEPAMPGLTPGASDDMARTTNSLIYQARRVGGTGGARRTQGL